MHMSFWFGADLGAFILPRYNVTTAWGLVGACLGLVALALLYEAMKLIQIRLHRMNKAREEVNKSASNEDASLLHHFVPEVFKDSRGFNCAALAQWLLEVAHYALHNTVGYLMMLAAMTYNGYVCLALVLGAAIGYYVFGPAFLKLNLNELRQRYRVIPCEPECLDAIDDGNDSERRDTITVSTVAEQLLSEINAEVHAGNDS